MAHMSAHRFCYGSDAQLLHLKTMNIDTLQDLVMATRRDVTMNVHFGADPSDAIDAGEYTTVLKRHLIGYVKRHLGGIFVDVDKLVHKGALIRGGKGPLQWYGLRRHRSKPVPFVAPYELPAASVTAYNNRSTEEDALNEAIRFSLSLGLGPTTVPTESHKTHPTKLHGGRSTETPDELCCPITLCLFNDPVMTQCGTTYERQAIAEWLATRKTDPMTNAPLDECCLRPNAVMKSCCDRYRQQQSTQAVKARRGHRGRRGSGRGGSHTLALTAPK